MKKDSARHPHSHQPLVRLLDSVVEGDNCDIMRQWPDESVDLVVTSPPYDDLRTYGGHSWDFYGVAWNLKRILKPGGVIVWNVADATVKGTETGSSMRQGLHFLTLGMNLHDTMIYAKLNPMPKNDRRYEPAWEYAFVVSKGKPNVWNPITEPSKSAGKIRKGTQWTEDGQLKPMWGNGQPVKSEKVRKNVWEYAVGCDRDLSGSHPARFPIQFAIDHIRSWSNPGDIVVDPFAGSGTTLKAAKDLGRRFVGIELSPEFAAVARKRLISESNDKLSA